MYIPRAGICMVYTLYIHRILKFNCFIFYCILMLYTHAMVEDNLMSEPEF